MCRAKQPYQDQVYMPVCDTAAVVKLLSATGIGVLQTVTAYAFDICQAQQQTRSNYANHGFSKTAHRQI